MVERELRDALDECLTLHIEEQVTLEGCLARYPKQAAELRPLLEMAIEVRRVAPPEPSPAAVAMGRERMLRAVAARERRRAKAPSAGLRARAGALLGDLRRALAQRPAMAAGWAAAAAVMLLLLVGGLFLRSWMGQAVPQLATLEVTEGVVQVQSRGGEGWLPAASGQQVEPGARIRTAADAAALLTFFDGSMTAMRGETELTIDRLRAPKDGAGRVIVLHQERGWTQHRVETMEARGSRFEVRSPLAVMAVRGTEFAVAVQDDGTTEVTLREGLVEVKARGSTIQLQPGWATTVEPEQPPATPFEAPAPLAVDVFPTRPASEEAETATASASRAPTERPSPTWTPTRTPVPTDTPAEDEPDQPATPEPEDTARPPTATAKPVTPTATPTERPMDDDDVPTPPGPTEPPTSTPAPTATEKPQPTEQPTETGIPTPPGPTDEPPTPTEARPGDEDVPTPGGPGGG